MLNIESQILTKEISNIDTLLTVVYNFCIYYLLVGQDVQYSTVLLIVYSLLLLEMIPAICVSTF